jgi:predicted outer membrane repeat protein
MPLTIAFDLRERLSGGLIMTRLTIVLIALVAFARVSVMATIIAIPSDYAAIQQGIDVAVDDDTVLVQPGTYVENLNFGGKNIVVASLYLTTSDRSYVSSTIIDGSDANSVVLFENGETSAAVIEGFTLRNGHAQFGGGVSVSQGPTPSILFNIIENNIADQSGGGISCWSDAHATITGNLIIDNSAAQFGGGILCSTNCNAIILGNTILNNSAGSDGGGILSWQSNPTSTNTIYWDNNVGGGNNEISGTGSVTYCDVEGGWTGEGNIDCDPDFCDPLFGNYNLDPASCCAGSGQDGDDMGAFPVGCSNAPTLSEWGMIALGLMLMAAGTIAVIRRPRVIEHV